MTGNGIPEDTITVTLPLAGLPASCPHCAACPPDGHWALSPVGHVIHVICPVCFTAIAPVRVVAAPEGQQR
jgi:hypothetical protein